MTVVAPNLCKWRCPLTIDHTQVSENGTYAVVFTGVGEVGVTQRLPDHLFANCQSDGGDICFTDELGNRLAVELVSFVQETERAEIWVSVPLSVSADAVPYVCYGSKSGTLSQPAADAEYGSQAVWGEGYALVSHDGGLTDSTANANNGTNHGTVGEAGIIGGGIRCDESGGDYVDVSSVVSAFNGSRWLCSAWVEIESTTQRFCPFGVANSQTNKRINQSIYEDGNLAWYAESQGYGYVPTPSIGWHLIVWGYDSTGADSEHRALLWVDGQQQSMTFATLVHDSLGPFDLVVLGQYWYSGWSSGNRGLLDEPRILTTARSADYIATDYAIQSSTAFVTVGTPQSTSTGRRRKLLLLGSAA